jgi:hypothetical protein
MADFTVRASSVDVEQIMRQIRSRIREKRGVDYTEEQIQELARVKLEKFLDPRGLRSDLLERFRQLPSDQPEAYEFDDKTLFTSINPVVRFFRRLLHPFLKLLFSPNTLNQTLHRQAQINGYLLEHAQRDALVYEVLHNLVVEVTRSTIEVKNMKMRVESIASRLEFNERRARALEAVVQYRPDAQAETRREDRRREPREEETPGAVDPITGGESLRSRRRRRRRGRRSGPGFAGPEGEAPAAADAGSPDASAAGGPAQPRGDADPDGGFAGSQAATAPDAAPRDPERASTPAPPAASDAAGPGGAGPTVRPEPEPRRPEPGAPDDSPSSAPSES